jgi:RND family efflux transporter MFP subunit
VVLLSTAAWLWAHEGHQALPNRGASVDADKGLIALSPEARQALAVEVAEVSPVTLDEEIIAPALIEAPWHRHAYASARLGGKVAAIHVRPGDSVAAGQPVAEVESLDLEDLRRSLLNAHNEEQLARANLAKLESLHGTGATADQPVYQARTLHEQQRNSLELARLKLQSIGVPDDAVTRLLATGDVRAVRTLPVLSPVAGAIMHVDVGIGQTIEPAEHLMEIVDTRRLAVRVRLLEKDLARVNAGQSVTVSFPGAAASSWSGTVRMKEHYLDRDTHWGAVWTEFANPQGILLPGLAGEARLAIPAGKGGLGLPASALVAAGAERYVFVEDGPGQYRRSNVVVQRQRGDIVQVAPDTGLYPGDRVVTSGSHELATLLVPGVLQPSAEARRQIGLRVEPARREAVADSITLNGVVDLPPSARAIVASRLAGNLARIAVERDQHVHAGDIVAEVASLEFHDLQLALLRSHLDLQLLEGTRKRQAALAATGALSERTLRELDSSLTAARQQRDSLKSKLLAVGLNREQLEDLLQRRAFVAALPIRAPIAGTVVRFHAVLGQSIKAEAPLFEVLDLSQAMLRIHVPERQVPMVQVGQRGRVRLTADPGFVAEAVVVRKGLALGTTDRTLPFWAEFSVRPRTPLLLGMMARTTLTLAESTPALAVPIDAVLREGSGAFLFLRRADGTFERRRITTGRTDDRLVEVTSGLVEGEQVAVQGVADLQTGFAAIR